MWVKWAKRIFSVGLLFFLIGATYFGVIFIGEMRHASELIVSLPDKLKKYSEVPSKIVSADGQVLYAVQSEFREPVKYEQIPQKVRDAIVAAEDKRFFEHSGVDYWAMGRIILVGAKEGRLSQGGSTLTMQLAKRFYSEGQKTMKRKLQDVALAITMERDMTKEQILTLYLNTMYFGEKAYGVQAAADVYFGKPLDKLTLGEAAMLARCVRRPSDENPVKNLDKATENRNVVLAIMRDEKMIKPEEYEAAIAEKPEVKPPRERLTSHLNKAPFFVAHVLQTLEEQMPDIDLKQGGYTIYTTLDTRMEDIAERRVAQFVAEHRSDDCNTAAFVLMDKEGKILAEVGGQNYNKNQYNIITQGLLQPGSSFKPFVYSAALTEGVLSMNDQLENQPFEYPMGPGTKPWTPHNSSERENGGPVGIERAIAASLNIPAAHVMERVGPSAVAALAHGAFGFRSKLAVVPSMALGTVLVHPLEMAQGYSVFMLHGDRATPYCITKITGPDQTIIQTYEPNIVRNQLDPRVSADIEQCLRAVVTGGTGTSADIDEDAHGKTGTTSDHKDIWFCGWTNGLIGVGWAGNNVIRKGKVYQLPMGHGMWGATTAADMWAKIMSKARDRFASKVADAPIQKEEPYKEPKEDVTPPDEVKVSTTGDSIPPDGTTGGDGKPIVVPGKGPTNTTGGATGGPPPDTDPGSVPATRPPSDNPPPHRDPPKRHQDRGDQGGETVQVDVCAETGMRATIYCPETVTRTFKKGQEPRRRCTTHGG
jgi:penicillin-binding protein 1A